MNVPDHGTNVRVLPNRWTKGADTDDWNWVNVGIPKVQQNYEDIIAGDYSTHGVIVLSHELNNETMALSEQFLPQIQKKFTGGVMPVSLVGISVATRACADHFSFADQCMRQQHSAIHRNIQHVSQLRSMGIWYPIHFAVCTHSWHASRSSPTSRQRDERHQP